MTPKRSWRICKVQKAWESCSETEHVSTESLINQMEMREKKNMGIKHQFVLLYCLVAAFRFHFKGNQMKIFKRRVDKRKTIQKLCVLSLVERLVVQSRDEIQYLQFKSWRLVYIWEKRISLGFIVSCTSLLHTFIHSFIHSSLLNTIKKNSLTGIILYLGGMVWGKSVTCYGWIQ